MNHRNRNSVGRDIEKAAILKESTALMFFPIQSKVLNIQKLTFSPLLAAGPSGIRLNDPTGHSAPEHVPIFVAVSLHQKLNKTSYLLSIMQKYIGSRITTTSKFVCLADVFEPRSILFHVSYIFKNNFCHPLH